MLLDLSGLPLAALVAIFAGCALAIAISGIVSMVTSRVAWARPVTLAAACSRLVRR